MARESRNMAGVRRNAAEARNRAEASIRKQNEMPVLGTDLKITGFSMDINGNSVIKLKQRYPGGNERGFSIQTNGNLPMVHARRFRGIEFEGQPMTSPSRPSGADMVMMSQEIANYIRSYGTARQKRMLDGQTNLTVGRNRMSSDSTWYNRDVSYSKQPKWYNRRLS